MLPEQIINFREMVTLKDGAYVLLRAMVSEDKNRLSEFYGAVSEDDMRFLMSGATISITARSCLSSPWPRIAW
jgi:hypothetical protein